MQASRSASHLRHLVITGGSGLNTVRQMVGHSSIETTARYDLDDGEAMRMAVKCLGLKYKKSGNS